MAKKRPWEPLLIIFAIVLANAGLVTVLLINEGATQGELLQNKQNLLTNSLVTPSDKAVNFTKEQYSLLRRSGFTQLIAFTTRDITLTCSSEKNEAQETKKHSTITLLGIDSQPFLGSRMRGFSVPDMSLLQNSMSTSQAPSKNNTRIFSPKPSNSQRSASDTFDAFAVNGLLHPATSAKLNCHNHHVPPQIESAEGKETQLFWPANIATNATNLVPQDTLVIPIEDFYKGSINVNDGQFPLAGVIALTALNTQDISDIEAILGISVSVTTSGATNETGSLPDSFRLNLWAMSALMGVVALFIVLNALNLMYRTRLPNIIRFRQLGISSAILTSALFTELLLYCLISIPIGMFLGFQAATLLSPVISGTFTSLFNAVFVNPDVNLLSLFGLALFVTFLSLALFALVPVTKLSKALTVNRVKKTKGASLLFVLTSTLFTLLLLFAVEQVVASTASALFFVALLLLSSCVLVLLWLPIIAKALTSIMPKRWPVFYYVIANMHSLSGKTRLAVCAFFIALTANIGMNTMTDSFRNATEQWLTQRLYAPFYLYTNQPLSKVKLLSSMTTTPLLKVEGKVIGVAGNEGGSISRVDAPTKISISSYPVHDTGKKALVLDSVLKTVSSTVSGSMSGSVSGSVSGLAPNSEKGTSPQNRLEGDKALNSVWRKFVNGEGVFINQQLAYKHDITLGDTLAISSITLRQSETSDNAALNAQIAQAGSEVSSTVFSTMPKWKVLGIYPDYGNLNGQVLVPLPFFATQDDVIKNALYSGVMAIYPTAKTDKPEAKSAEKNKERSGDISDGLSMPLNSNDAKFKAQVEKVLDAQPQMRGKYTLYAKQNLLDISMQTFDRTFVLTDGLNITTLLVAGIAFAVSLTVLTLGSAAQLSVLRALGVSQIKVKFALFMQYMLLCFMSALLAVPFGIYLAYVFINLVNRYAFNWTYPLAINAQVIVSSVGLSLLIVSLVLLLPLGKLKPKIDLRQEVQL
ncbi:ABC transporter permease [Alteromonas sp. IB21]|uniref:FtsX-like permease family protein n=1 Tax=Alteromonas sp. IB21 TaxID=2779369 RepID=UPI0018E90220|nr:ABC transporter permease [Alteromonas sp. IB21]